MTDLVFNPPGRDAPGFLRRSRDALRFQERIKGGDFGPELVDDMIKMLVPYVEQPVDRDAAAEALLDASQDQFDAMLQAVAGSARNPTPEMSTP